VQTASVILREFLRLACVFALVMVGFAHRTVSAYPLEAQMPVYQLPDGTFASICLDDHGTKPTGSKDPGCEACRLSGALLVPAPPCVAGLAIAYSHEVRVFERRQRLARALYPPNSGPRAPPIGLMFA
jgi:hypothetical protein